MPMPQLIPIIFDENDADGDPQPQPTVTGDRSDVLDLTVIAGGDDAESATTLSGEEEVKQWLDAVALCFGLPEAPEGGCRWIDLDRAMTQRRDTE